MTKTMLLHIGTQKTGTTSIQSSLAQAHRNGGLRPVYYPSWGRAIDLNECLLLLYRRYDELPLNVRQRYPKDDGRFRTIRSMYRRRLFRELGATEKAVISSEYLGYFRSDLIAALRDDLESVGFRDFRIVLYIRDPARFFLSQTQQMLKGNGKSPLGADPRSFRYGFRSIAEKWEQAFPGRLIVRKYSDDPGDDVVEDFSGVLKQCLGVALPKAVMRQNSSLSAEAMQIMQCYRLTFPPDEAEFLSADAARLRAFLSDSASVVPQTRPVLKDEVAAVISANHREDARWLYSRYGLDLGISDVGPAEALPDHAPWRVEHILESLDPAIVDRLLLQLAHTELAATRGSLPLRTAARVYRSIPAAWRPSRLEGRLSSLARTIRL